MRRASSAHISDAIALRANSSDGRFMRILYSNYRALQAETLTLYRSPRVNILDGSLLNQTVAVGLKIVGQQFPPLREGVNGPNLTLRLADFCTGLSAGVSSTS